MVWASYTTWPKVCGHLTSDISTKIMGISMELVHPFLICLTVDKGFLHKWPFVVYKVIYYC
uniref:Uncharacterized protein n=1 Tax=Anguilla anguilla TaxID=7936 RepID=A0A0E9QX85_ANGAN